MLVKELQRLIRSLDQVNSPYMLDASFQVATQETLARNQEELQKEINGLTMRSLRKRQKQKYWKIWKPQSYAYEMENMSKSSNNYSDNRKKKKKICRR